MQYIVLDLEWNQAMSSKSSVFNRLPIHLRGEIIQIGAVKLTEDMQPGEEFQADVKPVYFKRMHYKVKKLTGFDKDRLDHGLGFDEAMERFREWCGDECTFITWGYDDQGIMEQNIIIHDLDWDWIAGWMNVQLIFNVQTNGDRNQKSLKTAMEHYEIEQTRIAHDALGDAYNTARVCARLDMVAGIEQYATAVEVLAARVVKDPQANQTGPAPLSRASFSSYDTRADAFANAEVVTAYCPDCGTKLTNTRWVNQGDKRYMTLASCKEHGKYLLRVRFHTAEDSRLAVNRLLYRCDADMETYYRTKAAQVRRRGRGSRSKKQNTRAARTIES